jgi:hypothetical protein
MSGEYIIIKQNGYMRKFRNAGSTDAKQAKPLSELGIRRSGIFRRMANRGVFVETGEDVYYMDPEAADEFVAVRRRRILITIGLVVLVGFILYLAGVLKP